MSLWVIIKSRFDKEPDEPFVEERRKICATCPYNSFNRGTWTFKQKLYKYLSDFYTWLTRAENEDLGECECTCSIWFKTKDINEECWAKEKYGDDKWKSIYVPNSSGKINGK